MSKISQDVYDYLKTRTEEIREDKMLLKVLEKKIESRDYSNEAKNRFRNDAQELRASINYRIHESMSGAKKIIKDYLNEVDRENRLDPKQITDDMKLMTPGIYLTEKDIQAMLERNAENRTMTQIILRYAKENNILPKESFGLYVHGDEERKEADALETTVQYYERWMGGDSAESMLNRFFNVWDVPDETLE